MNPILSLRLSEHEHINIISQTADLESITCCDKVSIILKIKDQKLIIADSMSTSDLEILRKGLEKIITKKQQVFTFSADQQHESSSVDTDTCCSTTHSNDDNAHIKETNDNSLFLALYIDQYENFSIEIGSIFEIILKKSISADILQSWYSQLELLHVLTEENEKAKQSKGKGCC